MKRKNLIIFFIFFLLCGCTSEYNLKINNDNYEEELTINATNQNEKSTILKNDWVIDVDFNEFDEIDEEIVKEEKNNYYNIETKDNSLVLSYIHNLETIKNATLIKKCFDKVTITKESNKLYLSTTDKFKCFDNYPELNSLKITIETEGNVISNNANKVENNKYICNYNKNTTVKPINITVEFNNQSNSSISSSISSTLENKNYSYYIFITILMALLGIGYLIYKILKKYSDNNNEI